MLSSRTSHRSVKRAKKQQFSCVDTPTRFGKRNANIEWLLLNGRRTKLKHNYAFFSIRRSDFKRFRAFPRHRRLTSFAGPCFSSGSADRPSHDGISRTRRLHLFRVLIAWCDRNKNCRELVSSVVPRRTSFRRQRNWFETLGSRSDLDFLRELSGRCRNAVVPGPSKFRAVAPHAVHDHRQPPCQRDDGLLASTTSGDIHRPGFQPGPSLHPA